MGRKDKDGKARGIGFKIVALPVIEMAEFKGVPIVDLTDAKVDGRVVPKSDVRVEGCLPLELYRQSFVAMIGQDEESRRYFNATARKRNGGGMFMHLGEEREGGNYSTT